ncbi:hypothetical protein F4X33_04655 [Candidatus Poribacteria bacterium]|nr:hypothetical protein [Candidatus Poribacteria bacterium]
MSIKEVKNVETNKLIQDTSHEGELVYEGVVANKKCTIHYEFTDGILTAAGYILTEIWTAHDLYLTDYYTITDLLDKKYNDKSRKQYTWTNPNSVYKDPSKYGTAIFMGDLIVQKTYNTANTTTKASISGGNLKISTMIFYQSKKYKKRADKKKEAKALADF